MDVDAPPAASAVHPGLAAAREIGAAGPGPDADALRRAYLDVLKLCLTDLGGTTTGSVGLGDAGAVASRELAGEQRRLRAAGMDWPLHGLTMVGLNRLDDLQRCVESVVRDRVEGDLLEAGVWRGGASMLMRATLDALGDRERTVWVADSFQGFPERDAHDRDSNAAPWSSMDYLSVPVEEVRASFARFGLERGVRFVPGFFQETLPALAGGRWSLVRLDGDTYDATRLALDALYPGLAVGGYVIIDDYGVVEDCSRAVHDFRAEHGIDEPLEQPDWASARWRRETPGPDREPAAAPEVAQRPAPRPVSRTVGTRVATLEEVELTGQVAALRERLAAAEQELERLRRSPLNVARARLARALRRVRS
jgi:O-methyltransferase